MKTKLDWNELVVAAGVLNMILSAITLLIVGITPVTETAMGAVWITSGLAMVIAMSTWIVLDVRNELRNRRLYGDHQPSTGLSGMDLLAISMIGNKDTQDSVLKRHGYR